MKKFVLLFLGIALSSLIVYSLSPFLHITQFDDNTTTGDFIFDSVNISRYINISLYEKSTIISAEIELEGIPFIVTYNGSNHTEATPHIATVNTTDSTAYSYDYNNTGQNFTENPFDDDTATFYGFKVQQIDPNDVWFYANYTFNLSVMNWNGEMLINSSFRFDDAGPQGAEEAYMAIKIYNYSSSKWVIVFEREGGTSLNILNVSTDLDNPEDFIKDGNVTFKWDCRVFGDAITGGFEYCRFGNGRVFNYTYNINVYPSNITIYAENTLLYENLSLFNGTTRANLNTTALNHLLQNCTYSSNPFCIMNFNFTATKVGTLRYLSLNFSFLPYLHNFETKNVLETSEQTIWFTIINLTNSTDINAYFVYNGTSQTLTKTVYPTHTNFSSTFFIPVTQLSKLIYNNTFYWEYNYTFPIQANESRTSLEYNQTVYNVVVGNCSGIFIPETVALNITFYDYNDVLTPISYEGTAFYGLATVERQNQNFSFENSNLDSVAYCIYPNWSSIQVNQQNRWYDGANYYDYFLYNNTFTNITQYLSLYTQNTSETTQVLFTAQDTNTDPLENVYIHILKYNVGTGSYTVQEILKTDSKGQAIGNIVLYNNYYNFLLYYQGKLVHTEQAVKLIVATRTFTVNLEGVGWVDDFEVAYGISYDLYFNNNTNNFVFTWSDSTSAAHYGCLKVDVNNETGKYTLSDTCVKSASGTIVYTISPYNSTTFTATGYMRFDINIVMKVIQEIYGAARGFFYREMPLLSLFLATIIMITLFCIGLPHPVIALSLMGLAMIITFILGLFTVAPIYLGGMIFLIIVQIYLASKR